MQQPTNCLSVFDHFVGLALKGLTHFILMSPFYKIFPVPVAFSVLQHLLEVMKVLKIVVMKSLGTNWVDTVVDSLILINAVRNHDNFVEILYGRLGTNGFQVNLWDNCLGCLGHFLNALNYVKEY